MLPSRSTSESALDKETRMLNSDRYDELSNNDDDITLLDGHIKLQRKRSIWSRIIAGLGMIYVVVSLVGMSALSWKLDKVSNDHDMHNRNITAAKVGSELGDCGHSIETARAAGCIFDPMSWLWIAPACYEPHVAMVQDWKDSTDWHFYNDVELTNEVSVESAYRGDYPKLFTSFKYHKIHCSYSWRRQHAILSGRLPTDDKVLSKSHMNHCQMVLLNEFFHKDVNCTVGIDAICPIQLIPEFTKCGYYF